tara:strand:+ start:55 stop:474 length:420 start_codon:yes stop_codon:yes gene_type:complete
MTTTTGRGLAVISPKLIYTDDGKHCYGYNTTGLITAASGETTLFLFETKFDHLKLYWSPGASITSLSQSNKSFGYRFYLNGVIAWQMLMISSASNPETEQAAFYDKIFIVPPRTEVKITAISSDDGGATYYGAITGHVV